MEYKESESYIDILYSKLKRKVKRTLYKICSRKPEWMQFYRKLIYNRGHRIYGKIMQRNQTEKIIVFEVFAGRSYVDSPRALYLAMKEDPRFEGYTFVWSFRKRLLRTLRAARNQAQETDSTELPIREFTYFEKQMIKELQDAVVVRRGSKLYFQYLAKAKYWIVNFRMINYLQLREEQNYVQTWHGTPFKRLGNDIQVETDNAFHTKEEWVWNHANDSARYQYLISPSTFYTEKICSAFQINQNKTKIIEKGYPRNDELFHFTDKQIIRIKKELEIPLDKKIILYAPTYRENQTDEAMSYTLKLSMDFEKMYQSISDEYVILLRTHYLNAAETDFERYPEFLIDASKHNNINELYIISDVLITDYSSVFFDYGILNRPILFFMYDFEEYANKLRGFYFGTEELPGEITQTEDVLIERLRNLEGYTAKWKSKLKSFNQKYNYNEDGHATERVINELLK